MIEKDCDLRCWACNRKCEMKKLFEEIPEPIFNQTIMDSLKAWGGMIIANGGTRQEVDEEIKKLAVALSLSRKEYLKRQKQK